MPTASRPARSLLALALVVSLLAASAPASRLRHAAPGDRPARVADDPRRSGPVAAARGSPRTGRHRRRGGAAVHVARGAGAHRLDQPSQAGRPRSAADGRLQATDLAPGRPPSSSFKGPQPRLDPGPRDRPFGVVVRVLVVVLPGQPRVPLGLRRHEQHLSLRARPQRVQTAPRRVRPGKAQKGMKVYYADGGRQGRHLRRVVVEGDDPGRRAPGRTRGSRAEPDAADVRRGEEPVPADRPARQGRLAPSPSRRRAGPRILPGDDQALDLARPLADLGQLRVAHEALDRIVGRVAVAAVDLDRGVRGAGSSPRRRTACASAATRP